MNESFGSIFYYLFSFAAHSLAIFPDFYPDFILNFI